MATPLLTWDRRCSTQKLLDRLGVKTPAAKISLPVRISLLIASEESVAIGLLVDITSAKRHVVPVSSVLEEVRTPGIVALPAASVTSASKQAVAIAILVSTTTVTVVAIDFSRVNECVVVDLESMTIATPVPVTVLVVVTILVAVPVTITISVAIAIAVSLGIAHDWAIAFSIFVKAAAAISVSFRIAHDWAIAFSIFVDAAATIWIAVAIRIIGAVADAGIINCTIPAVLAPVAVAAPIRTAARVISAPAAVTAPAAVVVIPTGFATSRFTRRARWWSGWAWRWTRRTRRLSSRSLNSGTLRSRSLVILRV